MNKEIYGYIYMIRNKVNGKIYIGKTVNSFDVRYCYDIVKNTHNKHLKRAFEKYGIENFDIKPQFDVAYSNDELLDLEDMYICMYDCIKKGYNDRRSGSKCGGYGIFEDTRKVICLTYLMFGQELVFRTSQRAYWWVVGKKVPGTGGIVNCCLGYCHSFGEDEATGEPLVWAYYDDYKKMSQKEIYEKLYNASKEPTYKAEDIDTCTITYEHDFDYLVDIDDVLEPVYKILSPMQKMVFKEYLLNNKTLQEIADKHKITTTRVGNLKKQVEKKIKDNFTEAEFYDLIKK